ncbi:unnamed protein product [Caenorhabditis bovis]|uniref:Uncharacterized protein n=1 Tax=Caenorhabditis bovis TaxID=2654633 RepID=A0A8S1F834_9PELO|nr:unnamed protein product [Caenorhabditis bovis]
MYSYCDGLYDPKKSIEHCNLNVTGSSRSRLSLDSGISLGNDSLLSQTDESLVLSDSSIFSAPEKKEEELPATWARITTPPNRKVALKGNTPDATLSPASERAKFSANLQTPKSLRNIFGISSPSSIKIKVSKTPLKLSNEENVAGYRFTGPQDITEINSRPVLRCIGITSGSKRCLVPPVVQCIDPSVPSTSCAATNIPETPSKHLRTEFNGIFDEFDALPILSPAKELSVFSDNDCSDAQIEMDRSICRVFDRNEDNMEYSDKNDKEPFSNLLFPFGMAYNPNMKNKKTVTINDECVAIITDEPIKANKPVPQVKFVSM